MNALEKLDAEQHDRAKQLSKRINSKTPPQPQEIFHSSTVISTLKRPKLIIPSFTLSHVYANYPFAESLYVITCPRCLRANDAQLLREVLANSDIVPVLLGDYVAYPEAIVRVILEFPHVSMPEFMLYRASKIWSANHGVLCGHCVDERNKRINKEVKSRGLPSTVTEKVGYVFSHLVPFISPDYELLDLLADAVKNKDMRAIDSVYGTSETIFQLRTCQAYNSRSLLPLKETPLLVQNATKILPDEGKSHVEQISRTIGSSIGFAFSRQCPPKLFFKVANEHRGALAGMIDGLIGGASKDGEIVLSELSGRLAELNAEVRSLKHNKRYLSCKAAMGFLRANKVVVASALIAGALGLHGSFVSCGAAMLGGVGVKMLRKAGRLRTSPETEEFLTEVIAVLRPRFHQLIAAYSGVSLPAVQIQEISDDVRRRLKTSAGTGVE